MTRKKRKKNTAAAFCEACGQPLPKKRNLVAAGVFFVRSGTANAVLRVHNTERKIKKYRKRARHMKKLLDVAGRML